MSGISRVVPARTTTIPGSLATGDPDQRNAPRIHRDGIHLHRQAVVLIAIAGRHVAHEDSIAS
jgi:hypothetical protein